MTKLRSLLNRPHPVTFNWTSFLLPGGVVFFLLLSLRPFSLQKLPFKYVLGLSLLFAAITILCALLVVHTLRRLTKNWMVEENWTLYKELLLDFIVVISIALANSCTIAALDLFEGDFLHLLYYIGGGTFLLGGMPITVLVLFEQYSLAKKQSAKAEAMSRALAEQYEKRLAQKVENPTSTAPPEPLALTAENGKVVLQAYPNELYYLKSDGNYVEVFYEKEKHGPQKKLIRHSLKRLQEQLPEALFFQCHRSYLVNTAAILEVKGNARNYELVLRGLEERIPVSRAKSQALQAILKG